MTTKTITVTEEAYTLFKGLKKVNESFSDAFLRLAKEKDVATEYFGILKGDVSETRARLKKVREEIGKDIEVRKHVLSRHIRSS